MKAAILPCNVLSDAFVLLHSRYFRCVDILACKGRYIYRRVIVCGSYICM